MLPGIEALRGLAASMVMLHHALGESNAARGHFAPYWLTIFGAAGVDIFFVISGFVMYYTCFGRPGELPTPARFLLRRALRIYPFYWLCCAVMWGLHVIGLHKTFDLGPGDVILSLALMPSSHIFLPVSWTLVLEIYFYLVFAAALPLRNGTWSVLSTIGILSGLHLAGAWLPDSVWRDHVQDPMAAEFCFGLILARLFSRQRLGAPAWSIIPALVAIVLLPQIIAEQNTDDLPQPARLLAWGLPACILVAVAANARAFSGRLGGWIRTLGAASYALYLTHPFVMFGYAAVIKRSTLISGIPQQLIVPGVLIAAMALGILSHYAIEKPANTKLRQFALS